MMQFPSYLIFLRSGTALLTSALVAALPVLGGSVDNRNNSSPEYLRTLNRNAADDAPDAAVYNPAGTAYMAPGAHFSLANQTVYKDYGHTSATGTSTYRAELWSPFMPTAFAVYRQGPWSAFAALTFPGGGGNVEYPGGTVSLMPLVATGSAYNLETDASLTSIYVGPTLGGAYRVHPMVSVSVAGRYLWTSTQIEAEASGPIPGAPNNTSTLIDHSESSQGLGGVLGVHIQPTERIGVGLRFETITKLEWEVDRSELNFQHMQEPIRTGYTQQLRRQIRPEGARFNRDLPPNFGLGAYWKPIDGLRLESSFNYYLNRISDWGEADDKHDDGFEGGLSAEYALLPMVKVSLGAMATRSGANDSVYVPENPALNSYSLAGGLSWMPIERVAFDLGVTRSKGFDDSMMIPPLGRYDFEKVAWVIAIGARVQAF